MVAAARLPTVTEVPLYFKAVSVTLQPDEMSGISAANGILYQISGSTKIAFDGTAKRFNARGLFIAGGKTVRQYLQAGLIDELHFALSPVLLGRGEAMFEGLISLRSATGVKPV